MNELQVIKSAYFGDISCDVYSDESDMFMTSEQLGKCLGYANAKKGIENIIARNEYLKDGEFSTTLKMRAVDDKLRDVRVFTEDGIYEITLLAKTQKAKEFRLWVRRLLKSLRKKELLVPIDNFTQMKIQAQKERAEAMLLNAQNRMIKLLMACRDDEHFKQIAADVIGSNNLEKLMR